MYVILNVIFHLTGYFLICIGYGAEFCIITLSTMGRDQKKRYNHTLFMLHFKDYA